MALGAGDQIFPPARVKSSTGNKMTGLERDGTTNGGVTTAAGVLRTSLITTTKALDVLTAQHQHKIHSQQTELAPMQTHVPICGSSSKELGRAPHADIKAAKGDRSRSQSWTRL